MARRKNTQSVAIPSEVVDGRPDIFRFHDYRLFLRDWFAYLKSQENSSGFSMRELARKAGLSCAYLPMVLADHRFLSAKALEKIAPLLGLKSEERVYLELLRVLSDSESEVARLDAFRRIQEIYAYQQRNPQEIETYQYMENWFYVAIREMAVLPDFKAEPNWITARLHGRVSPSEVRDALEFLTEHGYLEIRPDGSARQIEKNVNCVAGVFRLVLRNFHRQMHSLSGEILDSGLPIDERYIVGYTLAYSSEQFREVKKIIDEAVDKLEALGKKVPAADTVYHVNLMAVPIAMPPKWKKHEKK